VNNDRLASRLKSLDIDDSAGPPVPSYPVQLDSKHPSHENLNPVHGFEVADENGPEEKRRSGRDTNGRHEKKSKCECLRQVYLVATVMGVIASCIISLFTGGILGPGSQVAGITSCSMCDDHVATFMEFQLAQAFQDANAAPFRVSAAYGSRSYLTPRPQAISALSLALQKMWTGILAANASISLVNDKLTVVNNS